MITNSVGTAKVIIIFDFQATMDVKEFAIRMKAKERELDKLIRSRMPKITGRLAKDHFQDNFRKSGFVNNGLHPWKPAKRLSSGDKGAAANYGTLLSGRNHLFSSIKYVPSDYRVIVSNYVEYAPVHNWGGTVNPTVTDRMRRFAWFRYYDSLGIRKKSDTGGKKRQKRRSTPPPENEQAKLWKRLALTKKTKLKIKIPQRQFLGESMELSAAITDRMGTEINKLLNI
ncbi:MAG: phage virion morphogenesis protein [Roseburia sp.]|nr:phage virion morphogenesis protein [Roseburia sp.]